MALSFLLLFALPPLTGAIVGSPPAVRDVLATAFNYPFLTDVEVEVHLSDTRGRISGRGGPALVRYPDIAAVELNGEPVPSRRAGPDLLQFELPAGVHELSVLTAGPGLPAVELQEGPTVATPEEFQEAAAKLKPGDEFVVRDGVYTGWKLDFGAEGTPESPIVIRPQTPGGVVFQRDCRVTLRGRHAVFRGFRFEHCPGSPVVLSVLGSDCRVSQCHFARCGNPVSTFAHIVEIGMGADRNRVDHCFFTGSKSMSLSQKIRAVEGVGVNNRFDHNLFRDIYRHWINGQENIQIGQNQRDPTGRARPQCVVEFNLFDHAWGDGEIISSKSTGNVIRHNVAAHCRNSAFTLRGGHEARFEGNVMVNNGDGLRVMGQRHTILNNLILDQPGWGLYLETGSRDGQNQVASEGSDVSHNTIVNCAMGAIGFMAASDERPHLPGGNAFTDNLFVGDTGALAEATLPTRSVVRHNLFWKPGPAEPAPAGDEAIVADPVLRGQGAGLHPAPDGPGRGFGAPAPHPGLPPIPPRPLIDLGLYQGEILFLQDPKRPMKGWSGSGKAAAEALSLQDGTATLSAPLPASFLLAWEHQPERFQSSATLTIAGYELSWGGVLSDGKPTGVIELRKDGKVVADGADLLLPSQQFRYKGNMNFKADTRTSPDPRMWHRFTLLKQGPRLILLLVGSRYADDPLPVIAWEDRDASPAPAGALRIEQRGTGRWRGFAAYSLDYAGDAPPPPPAKLTATATGAGRISLRWTLPRAGLTFDVFRGAEAGFVPSAANRLAAGCARGAFDDFDVAPDTRYFYRVRSANALGAVSEPADTEATTGRNGPLYRILPAGSARSTPPFELEQTAATPSFVWAPPGTTGDPQPGSGAEFRFRIDEAGDYALWGLVRAPDSSHDSFQVSLDGAPAAVWYTRVHPSFAWSRMVRRARLAPGEHSLRIQHREPGTALAAVLVTDDLKFDPEH